MKIRSRPGGDILEERISFLLDEYHRVRTGEIPGSIPALSAHYGVHRDWFSVQVRKLRHRHGVGRQKKGNVGRKRVWSETTTEELRHANGVYNRMASAATLYINAARGCRFAARARFGRGCPAKDSLRKARQK
jgi:hypothetical protein